MKKLSIFFFALAVLLSDVMCWVVGCQYTQLRYIPGVSAPPEVAFLGALPFLAAIALCAALGAWCWRKHKG